MAQTAQQLIAQAAETAKVPGFTTQGLTLLNIILGDLCDRYDLALARALYTFNFNPSLTTNFGSGPYPLPGDYLRTSGSSGSEGATMASWYVVDGVPYPMIPCDLGDFDMQVQQAGLASYPWLWATDMAVAQQVLSTVATATLGSQTLTGIGAATNVLSGMAVSGPGIQPGTVLTSGIIGGDATISLPTVAALNGSPVMFSVPPVGYAYPPPSGGYPVFIRYQRKMPDILTPTQIPWFPNQGYLLDQLTARLMDDLGDTRAEAMMMRAADGLSKYLAEKDDSTNRSKTVVLDRRTFGSSFSRLRNTKRVGF